MMEHCYLACIILVTGSFNWHNAVTLTLELFQSQIVTVPGTTILRINIYSFVITVPLFLPVVWSYGQYGHHIADGEAHAENLPRVYKVSGYSLLLYMILFLSLVRSSGQ